MAPRKELKKYNIFWIVSWLRKIGVEIPPQILFLFDGTFFKAGFTSERECGMWKRGEAERMVHLYTVWHSLKQRIDPTSKHILCELSFKYWQSTDCIMLFASPRQHIYIKRSLCFRVTRSQSHSVCIHMWTRLNGKLQITQMENEYPHSVFSKCFNYERMKNRIFLILLKSFWKI